MTDPTRGRRETRAAPFETQAERYDRWFDDHRPAYLSELRAVGDLLAGMTRGLEVGVGTGRFAGPLGVGTGIDPSLTMVRRAVERGIAGICARSEALPFRDAAFDRVVIVTTLCFVECPRSMLVEARRVLAPGGAVVLGFVDRASHLGQSYMARKDESVFYRDAVFYSRDEVGAMLAEAGFVSPTWLQTLTRPIEEVTRVEPPRPGRGEGGFLAVRGVRA